MGFFQFAKESDEGVELSKYFYEPENMKVVNGFCVTSAEEKRRLEKKQKELYGGEKE